VGSTFGVKVIYSATFSNGAWGVGTPSGPYNTPGDSCWTGGGIGYGPATPCDHFGVGNVGTATKTSYSWLLESGTPGVLTPSNVNLPAPVWSVTPPVNPGVPAPPVVVAHIQAPLAEIEAQFGTPIWVKVYTTELEDPVGLEELVGNNAKVQQAKSHTEVEWQLLQTDPGNPLAGQLENGDKGAVGGKAESVIRRYEFFNYAGAFDPETHEALVASDSNPAPGDVGSFIGAQNVAINLNGNIPVVPEPETPLLMLAGLAALFGVARRRVGQ
jgi:PEP-CTERM motif